MERFADGWVTSGWGKENGEWVELGSAGVTSEPPALPPELGIHGVADKLNALERGNGNTYDRTRPEGAYVSCAIYPRGGGFAYSSKLFTITKVYGNCRSVGIVLTPAEVKEVVRQLTAGLAEPEL